MRNLIFTFSLLLPFISHAQAPADALLQLQVDVVYLASDLLEGRETGTKGEEMAAQYIVSRMAETGLQPKGPTDSWYQEFVARYSANPHLADSLKEERNGKNVIGYMDNGAQHTIVIGGHYDHLGHGITGSKAPNDTSIHNGADDNASGIAGILYLADQIRKRPDCQGSNYLFIAFSGEEMGLYGSKNFVSQPTIDLDQINYMINLDMVGRLNAEKELTVHGTGTSPSWKPCMERIGSNGLKIKPSESGTGPSDHTSFYLKDIPVLYFFSGLHEDYHKPGDDSKTLNYEGIYEICEYILRVIADQNGKEKLGFAKTKDKSEGRRGSAFKVSLGVMPDYVFEGEGMRIEVVIEGRVADKAGLKNGDVVTKLGETTITDMYTYMDALQKFEKGQSTEVIVKRGEEQLSKKVTF